MTHEISSPDLSAIVQAARGQTSRRQFFVGLTAVGAGAALTTAGLPGRAEAKTAAPTASERLTIGDAASGPPSRLVA